MAIDTPARIAIIGAGPVGLEAALYARFLGYDVDIYERGQVCQSLIARAHVRLFAPFDVVRSPLAMRALQAQDDQWLSPADEAVLSGREWIERYYRPIAESDLLADCLHLQTEVLSVGRQESLKHELPADDLRADSDFRLLVRTLREPGELPFATERLVTADAVLDCSGVWDRHHWIGRGGVPAVGELALADRSDHGRIEYGLPDLLGAARDHYAHGHTLVVGAGHSAASCVIALTTIARESPYTQVTWLTRSTTPPRDRHPIIRIEADPYSERDHLAAEANRLATAGAGDRLTHLPGTHVEQIHWQAATNKFEVVTSGQHSESFEFDRIIGCVGHRPNWQLVDELQIVRHFATDAPTAVSEQLQAAHEIRNPEPDYYVLGAKSFGRSSKVAGVKNFGMADGLDQIRQVFAIIGDRPTLNLYGSMRDV